MRFFTALTAALFTLALPALASPHADKVQTRILQGWAEPDGTRMAAIEIRLAEGWHTYWRAPGDAGIPPQLGWQGSRNLKEVTFHWPRPKVYESDGIRSIIYRDRLVLPMELSPGRAGKPILLKATLDIGVCKDICMPLQINLSETIAPDSRANVADIRTALASVPQESARNIRCRAQAGTRGLLLTLTADAPSLGAPEEAAVETGDPLLWATDPEVSRAGQTLTLTTELVHAVSKTFALNRSGLRFTLIGSQAAVDIQGCD